MKKAYIILAGGSGTRLWPVSSDDKPKFLLRLNGKKTLLEQTIIRAGDIFDKVIIVASVKLKDKLDKLGLSRDKVTTLYEHFPRNTGPAVTMAVSYIRQNFPEIGLFLSAPADHVIRQADKWQETVEEAFGLTEKYNCYTYFGLNPRFPSSAYGYILPENPGSSYVKEFIEKPDREKAEALIKDKALWNGGMFTGKVNTFLNDMKDLSPAVLSTSQKHLSGNTELYEKQGKISIEHLFHQKVKNRLFVKAKYGRIDVGNWNSIGEILPEDSDGNRYNRKIKYNDSANNTVFSNKKVHLLGVKDFVVAETDDKILVMSKASMPNLKEFCQMPDRKYKAIIFDWDGTLADTMPNKYLNAASVFNKFFDADKKQIVESYKKYSGIPRRNLFNEIAKEAIGRPINDDEFAAFSKEFTELNIKIEPVLFDETTDLIKQLKSSGYILGISSSATDEELKKRVAQTEVNEHMDVVFGSKGDFAKGIPHLSWICENFGIERDQILFVGDEKSDIMLAREAGVDSAGILNTLTRDKMLTERPDYIINSITELLTILDIN